MLSSLNFISVCHGINTAELPAIEAQAMLDRLAMVFSDLRLLRMHLRQLAHQLCCVEVARASISDDSPSLLSIAGMLAVVLKANSTNDNRAAT